MPPSVDVSKEAKFQARDLALAVAFAEGNEDIFDGNFIQDLNDKYIKFGYLTDKQYQALLNTIEKWGMEDWAEREGVDYL